MEKLRVWRRKIYDSNCTGKTKLYKSCALYAWDNECRAGVGWHFVDIVKIQFAHFFHQTTIFLEQSGKQTGHIAAAQGIIGQAVIIYTARESPFIADVIRSFPAADCKQ